jgi:3-hydroxybutyryl-CoA dehydrogenase
MAREASGARDCVYARAMVALGDIGVVGGGFMGTGIAEAAARAGARVRVLEPQPPALERSRSRLLASLERAVAGGKVEEGEAREVAERVSWTTQLDELGASELVVEAVVEDEAVKAEVFRALDATLPDAAVLASNTSSIPITGLAAVTARPGRVLGLHFFSPVPVMRLVEVVVGLETDDETVERAEAFVDQLGKRAIRTRDRAGFVVNALLVPYLLSAVRMLEEGFAGREDIDEGMRLGCGHPMGPLTLADFIGLDVLLAIAESLYAEHRRTELAPPPLLRRMVVAGRLGRKSGRGFYAYPTA